METREEHYQSMIQAVQRYSPAADLDIINQAFTYADNKHAKQLRKSGEPYIIHPLSVAEIVAEIGLDTDAIVAALLHDCLEDTDASYEDISRLFGETVAELVEGVTKLTRVQYSTMEEQQMENLRKMFMAMSKDIRVILIKIADRLHNTRTLEFQTPAKQISKSMETMEIYAPLAHRLGMQKIKWELEDVSLQYLDPAGYQLIIDYLKQNEGSANSFMDAVQSKITKRLSDVGIHGSIYGRVKHTYSIYRKMRAQNKTIEELYDLYAFRVIVDNIADCYNVLGHIHDLFNPVPGRFKDYISTPKPNMYQSLHTTVIGSQGIPFEVQIRTWEMHQTAEYGVAAHWKYKQNVGDGTEKEFEWVRRLLENQQDTEADDYIHSLKVDMFDDEVFVFTPKGKVISLRAGSTPIDFAYAIHSAVGNSMIGAKINNRIAGYEAQLHNGDIVEILTSKSAKGPSRDWLTICQSNQARIKIKQWFKREKRDENIQRGKASFESELRHIGVDPDLIQDPELLPVVLKKVSFDQLDDMYAAIGYGGLTAAKAVGRIKDELTKATKSAGAGRDVLNLSRQDAPAPTATGVIVEDIDSCMIKFSRCCTPVPGDDIIGYITKGFGVSVHRRDCPNTKAAQDPAQAGRWVKVTWAESPDSTFATSLQIDSVDRDGLMLDIATILTGLRIRVNEISSRAISGKALSTINFQVHNLEELETVRNRLHGISGVTEVRRGTD
ncbi:MAG: bifunctional (p)ppGpp synthetase/guanosine-3',5'-bis(diphosphate) 3'-pyrophosphohydrolase [Clostridia bacterium]|nr:bifunctional (p)ppGpp synthetase/guanosine-3',5'-bis(diphosphate) 3'-pyrophosphohydrolase [Clostridia bacterium]